MLRDFKLIIVENDYTTMDKKAAVDAAFRAAGFQRIYAERGPTYTPGVRSAFTKRGESQTKRLHKGVSKQNIFSCAMERAMAQNSEESRQISRNTASIEADAASNRDFAAGIPIDAEAEQLLTSYLDPFGKDFFDMLTIRLYGDTRRNGWRRDLAPVNVLIEFKRGNTSGSQELNAENLRDAFQKIHAFAKELDAKSAPH